MRTFLALAIICAALRAQAIFKVSRAGRYLYTDDGNRFLIKGLAYQEQGTIGSVTDVNAFPEPTDYFDPLADGAACSRDIPFFQQLSVNTIRVYNVDNSANHDSCMSSLSSAGIYTIIDLSLPVNGSINRASPAWMTNLLDLYTKTIDTFSKYDNVLAFNVGNEVVIDSGTTVAAPFIKAAVRDIKAYLKTKGSSALVGYASTDGPKAWRNVLANYLACETEANSIDVYGLNNYEWCGDADASAYTGTTSDYSQFNVPAYFSEYGCAKEPPRLFTEVASMYGPDLTNVWSGGVAFSYFPAQGGYGLVSISSDNKTVTTTPDFDRLKAQLGNVTLPNTPSKADAGNTAYPACPAADTDFLASSILPVTPSAKKCSCIADMAISCAFTPSTTNVSGIVGGLIDTGCSFLSGAGGNCDGIASDGKTGVYGPLSDCDPSTKLSYVFTEYYISSDLDPQSCDFGGNAAAVPKGPSFLKDVDSAVDACTKDALGGGGSTPSGSGSNPSPSQTRPDGAVGLTTTYCFLPLALLSSLGAFGSILWIL